MKKIFIIFVCFTMVFISCKSAPNQKNDNNELNMSVTDDLVTASKIREATNVLKSSKVLKKSDK